MQRVLEGILYFSNRLSALDKVAIISSSASTPVKLLLTNFLNFVTKASTAKMNFVAEVKQQNQFDLYGDLREHIQAMHIKGNDKKSVGDILSKLTNQQKINQHPGVIKAYQKFWGRKSLQWFSPPKAVWSHSGISIKLNPELGLLIDDEPHTIKNYFRQERLAKERISSIAHLMESQMRGAGEPDSKFVVLDIHRSKLGDFVSGHNYQLLLESEAEMFRRYWDGL